MLIYGRNVAEEYLKKNKKVEKIIIQDNFNDKKLNPILENTKIRIEVKPKSELDKLVIANHQGIILDVGEFEYKTLDEINLDKEESFLLLLDHLEDPHNFGAIIRTSEAAGVDGIIIPKDRSVPVNSTVIKTSTGAILNVDIAMVTNLVKTINILKEKGYWVVGTDMENSEDYRKLNYKGKLALVIGNEGTGISRLVKESCDYMAQIPMYGTTNSLNASVAAGIMIYEVVRQKRG